MESHDIAALRYLTFRVADRIYALPADQVSEVVRVSAPARIPQAPAALLGLVNLRGAVLPVASLRTLLKRPTSGGLESERVIVLDIGAPIGLMVDSVENLETVTAERIDTEKTEVTSLEGEKLVGAFATSREKVVAKILDVRSMLEAAFAGRRQARQHSRVQSKAEAVRFEGASIENEVIVSFEVAGQEFALPLDAVQEILPVPESITSVAHAESTILGVVSIRDTLLPLLSLRHLLGLSAAKEAGQRSKVIVMNVAGAKIGLVADRARAIVAADKRLIDPIPPVLAVRTGGESRIRSIYRGDAGRRLISILAPEQLFKEDVMQRLAADRQSNESQTQMSETAAQGQLIFLVFRLGDDEFGLPIDTVVEVAEVPPQITRVPKTPKFLEGVVNLRGDVLPVVDQRRRFDMPALENTSGRRLVVIKTERHRAGLIVDSVTDVLRAAEADIEPPPDLTDETSRLVRGVINLSSKDRIVLVLDSAEVLTRAEQGVLDTFQATSKKANA